MLNNKVRPPEWLHEKRCLANAIISAVQNIRDDETFGDHGFRIAMQENTALDEADAYLLEGLSDCICQAPWPDDEVIAENNDTLVQRAAQQAYGTPRPLRVVTIEGHEFHSDAG